LQDPASLGKAAVNSRPEQNPSELLPSELLPLLPVAIVPGFHERSLSEQLVRSLPAFVQPHLADVFPADPIAVFRWLTQTFGSPQASAPKNTPNQPISLVAIGFSAGVVGLTGALSQWQQQGGSVARFLAVDGWGVPIIGLPVSRLSHDSFTHWSSLLLGSGEVNFYADPPVAHLEMWGAADRVAGRQVTGWQMADNPTKSDPSATAKLGEDSMTAAEFLRRQLEAARNDHRLS
jgi:hypothetical protein